MIFQTSIDLKIDDRDVHVVFDLDTGMIGFTEDIKDSHKEYLYHASPPEFKIALAELMENMTGEHRKTNGLICRKGEASKVLESYWAKKK